MALVNLKLRAYRGSGSGERPTAAQLGGALGLYVDTSETPYGVYVCRDNGSGTMTYYALPVCDANGDVPVAFGGARQQLFYSKTNVAAGDQATAANSTPVACEWSGAAAVTVSFTAMRAGSLVGLSATLSAACAGGDVIIGVYKNGTILNAASIVTLASATSDTEARATFAKDLYTFAAGDNLDVRIRASSAFSATTADLGVAVEIET